MTAIETRWMDASHYQGVVIWTGLKSGYRLSVGVAKCTEGTTFTDSQFAGNKARIKAAALVFGAYHYARPNESSGAAQAKRFLAIAGLKPGDLAVLDLEADGGLSQGPLNLWAAEWGDYCRTHAPGVTLVLYAGRGYVGNGTGRNLSAHFDYLWTAHYATTGPSSTWPSTFSPGLDGNTTGWADAQAWQWSPNVGGKDATVSTLTVAELRDASLNVGSSDINLEEIMAWYASKAEFEAALAGAVWDQSLAAAASEGGGSARADQWLTEANIKADAARKAVIALTPQAIAAAVLAELPAAETGGLTIEQVEQAFARVLTGGTAAVSA